MWVAMNEHPDVIVTDLRMPNGDGDFMVECLKGRLDESDIPVITLTGSTDNVAKCWMQTLGVKHYLHKPLQFTKLLSALEEYIELRCVCEHV